MAHPGTSFSIIDPGLGLVDLAESTALVLGPSEKGTDNVITSLAGAQAIDTLVDTYGQGPMPECAARILGESGGPVRVLKTAESVSSAVSSVTVVRVGSSTGDISTTPPSGDAHDFYEVVIEIITTGDLGVGEFRFSLDNQRTWSAVRTIPSGGTFVIPNTGVTITFTKNGGPVFFEDGDKHSFSTTPAMYNATDLGNADTAIQSALESYNFLVLSGKHADATTANALFAALDADLTTHFNAKRVLGAIMDAGDDDVATTKSTFTSTSSRIVPCYGQVALTTHKPIEGFGSPEQTIAHAIASRAASSLISTRLGRRKSGPVAGAIHSATQSTLSHDERLLQSMNDYGFATLGTVVGRTGVYITNGVIKSANGSDFTRWPLRRVMDEACRVAHETLDNLINSGVRTNADGTIDERDAIDIEAAVNAALDAVLKSPTNAEGKPGHVSAVRFSVDRTNNVNSTSTLQGQVAIRPLGYAEFISVQLGYQLAA